MSKKFSDISVEEWKKLSEEDQKNFKEVIKQSFLGFNKVTMENKAEEARSKRLQEKKSEQNMKVMSGIWKQSKITSTAIKVVSNNWGKILGLAIFLLPKTFWVNLKDTIFRVYNFFKGKTLSKIWSDFVDKNLGKVVAGIGILTTMFAPNAAFMVAMAGFKTLMLGFKGMKWVGGKIFSGSDVDIEEKRLAAQAKKKAEIEAKKKAAAAKKITATPDMDSNMEVTKKGKPSWWKETLKKINTKVSNATRIAIKGIRWIPLVGNILNVVYETVMSVINGKEMAEELGIGKDSAIIGSMLGGRGEGVWNVAGQALTYGMLGMSVGGPIGGVAGMIFGSVMGIIGGKKMAQAFENLKLKFETLWIEWVETPFQIFMDDINHYLIKPINEFFEPFGKWMEEKMKPLIDGLEKWYKNIKKWMDGFSSIKKLSNLISGDEEENRLKVEQARKAKEAAEKERERKRQEAEEARLAEELAKKQEEIKELKKEIAEDEKNIAKGKDSYGFFRRSREDRLDDNLARLTELTGETQRRRQSQGTPQGARRTTATPATPASPVSSGHELITTPSPISASKISYPRIPDDGGTTNMDGVKWNKMHTSGRSGVEAAIWEIYNNHGKKPVFVSGLRDKNHALYNPKSQHAYGLGFDLRSRNLGASKEAISSDLHRVFNQKGWFMQEEIAGQANTTGTKATGDHFHIHKAAKGFHGVVESATGFIAGEAGSERVDITPLNGPNAKLATFNNLQNQNLDAQRMGGSGGGTTVIAPQTTKVSQSSTTAVLSNPTAKDTFWNDA